MVLGRRYAGNEVCVTNAKSLRSRVKRKFHARFWRAAALVRESPTLIINVSTSEAEIISVFGVKTVLTNAMPTTTERR
jgi:hypothetical protein